MICRKCGIKIDKSSKKYICNKCNTKEALDWKRNNKDKVKNNNKKYRDKYREILNKKFRDKYREINKVKEEKYRIDENGEKIIRVKIRNKYKGKYSTRFAVLRRDSFTCQYCGRKAPFVVLEIDHKIPKSKGGNWTLDNLITSCFECNRGKRNHLL